MLLLAPLISACANRETTSSHDIVSSISGTTISDPVVQAAAERVEQSDARVIGARAALLPTIDGVAEYNSTHNDSTGVGSESNSEKTIGVSGSMPLFRGFANINRLRSAGAGRRAAEHSYVFTRDDVLVQIVTAIAEVERDQQALNIRRTELRGLNNFLGEARQRLTAGATSQTDINQIRTRIAATQAGLAQSEATLQASRARRDSLIQGAELSDLEFADLGPYLPASQAEAVEIAISSNSNLDNLASQQDAAKYNVSAAQGAFLPTVDLSVIGEHDPDGNATTGLTARDSVETRINLRIPLYDGGARRAQLNENESIFRERRFNYEAARRDLAANVHGLWARTEAARQVKRFASAQLDAARKALVGVREGRRIGARTVDNELGARQDVLDAELALYSARLDEIAAEHQLVLQLGRIGPAYGLDGDDWAGSDTTASLN